MRVLQFTGGLVIVYMTAAMLAAQSRGASGVPNACGLLSAKEVATATARPELAKARQISGTGDEPGSTGCGYVGTSLSVELQSLTSVYGADTATAPQRFNAAMQKQVNTGEFQPVDGLGDAAWFRDNKLARQFAVVVRVGLSLVTIAIDKSESGTPEKAREMLLPLAKTAGAKLR